MVLGSFYYGYVLTNIPGGYFAGRAGGKWLFGLGIFCTSLLTLLSPLAAIHGDKWAFGAVRWLEGLGEGVTYPAVMAMLAKWAPLSERSRLTATIYSGAQAGTVVALPLSGMLADRFGWESVFYVSGILGCFWFLFWVVFVYSSPAEHPWISKARRCAQIDLILSPHTVPTTIECIFFPV